MRLGGRRSTRTSNGDRERLVSLHAGRRVLVRLDLSDFFASVTAGRVYGIFRTAGYPPDLAHVLTGLTTNTVPQSVWQRLPAPIDPRLMGPHFPAIAGLAARRRGRPA